VVTSRPPDAAQFRQLLGRFATGVTVATTLDAKGKHVGMTASAIAAVSLDPPLVLLCVSPTADFHAHLHACRSFALNVLASDQENLSVRFAADGIDRFAGVPVTPGRDGIPLIAGAAAHIICEHWARYDAVGDHTVFVGRVVDGAWFERKPLIHYRSGYATTGDA
jgi:3-hydroxy-9,10-secoandrosta-1,3,5(10)-triene-9,17-dione monooxygenase reductase component